MSEHTDEPQDTGDVTPERAPAPAPKKPAAPAPKKAAHGKQAAAPPTAILRWRVTRAGELAGIGTEGQIKAAGVLAPQTGALYARKLIEPAD